MPVSCQKHHCIDFFSFFSSKLLHTCAVGLHGELHLPVLLLSSSTPWNIAQFWFAKRPGLNLVEVFNIISAFTAVIKWETV